jgi:glycosyltransferase involved in cell wall biosynthesis
MRVLQVVTLVSPDAAYGGPVTVAMNQSAALRELGHEVTIVGGARGYDVPPSELAGTPAVLMRTLRLVPRTGFSGLGSPQLWRWFHRHRRDFDVVHVHMARDLVTLPLALQGHSAGVPVVLQTHGMIDPSTSVLARLADPVMTHRALRFAAAVLYLTEVERVGLLQVEPQIERLVPLPNGVPTDHPEAMLDHSGAREVLFLARLHERKRAGHFVEAAAALAGRWPEWRFTLVGPDEGEGPRVEALIANARTPQITWEGAVSKDESLRRMSRAAVFAQPAIDEPFPMSVLEAMSVALPVVVTTTCGLADEVRRTGAGIVIEDSVTELTAALDRLIADAEGRLRMGAAGRTAMLDRFEMSQVARRLTDIYGFAAKDGSSAPRGRRRQHRAGPRPGGTPDAPAAATGRETQ